MDLGLETGAQAFAQGRASVPKVAVLLTTGQQAQAFGSRSLSTAVQRLWNSGANLYVVKIGGQTDRRELNSVVKNPDDIVSVTSAAQLPSHVDQVERKVTTSGIEGR